MSSYATKNRYQVGDQWLGQRSGSDAWYRMWFDPLTRQTRRSSLGTTDFELAKQLINDWFILHQTKSQSSLEDVTLAEIFARYFEHHGKNLVTSSNVSTSLRYWLEFHQEATIKEALTPIAQTGFRDYLLAEKQLAVGSARRILAVGKSALNWAWKRGEIDTLPYIALVKTRRAEPRGRPLELKEVAKLIETADHFHVKIFIIFMIATGGRTSAVVDLNYNQIDLDNELIHLNPDGREQNNKYRPTIRLPRQLKPFVEKQKELDAQAPVIAFSGRKIGSVRRVWRKTKQQSGLYGNVQTYSFRHTVARWLRQQSVPAWEVAAQLGHKMNDYSTTEIYAPYDPAYLSKSVEAIDIYLELLAHELGAKSISDYLGQEML